MTYALTRPEWQPKAALVGAMQLPARGVFIHHSVTPQGESAFAAARRIEQIGVTGFGRLSYSALGHRDVLIEGASDSIGAHTGGFASDSAQWNRVAYGYCFVGNYEHDQLTDKQISDFARWCKWAVDTRRLVPDFFIAPHRDVKNTACPGRNILARWDDLRAAANRPRGGTTMTISVGSAGEPVEDLQGALWLWVDPSIVVDGQFGARTAEASKRLKALVRDGCSNPAWVNPATPAWSNRTWQMYGEWADRLLTYLGAR